MRALGCFDDVSEINLQRNGQLQHGFKSGIPESALDTAEHGLGDAGTTGDLVLGPFPSLSRCLQQFYHFGADRLRIAGLGHAEGWLEFALTGYLPIGE